MKIILVLIIIMIVIVAIYLGLRNFGMMRLFACELVRVGFLGQNYKRGICYKDYDRNYK